MTRGLVLLAALLLVVAAVLLATRGDGPPPAVPTVDDTRVEAAEAPVGPAPSPAPERAVPEAGIESIPNHAPTAGRLRLLVRDADGSPAGGVKVVVGGAASDGEVPIVHAETDADTGALAVPWERLTSWAAWALAERGYAEVRLVGIEPLRVEFGRDAPPPAPVVIDLPPTGRVVVEVRDATGMQLSGRVSVELSRWVDRHTAGAMTTGGRAVFARVPLGLEFRAALGRSYDRGARTRERLLGPRRAGEEVRVTLTPSAPLVTGRALFASRAPAVDARLVVRGPGRLVVRTDDEGRFTFPIPRWLDLTPGSSARLEEHERPGGPPRRAELRLSAGDLTVRRLGDVILLEPPVLVAGVVVDDDGAPIEGVLVTIGRPRGEDWFDWSTAFGRTDAAGRFAVADPGLAPDVELLLRCVDVDFVDSLPLTFARGDRNVRVELARAGRIVGRVEAIPARSGLRVSVVDEEGHHRTSHAIRDDGTFSVPAEPGRRDLVVAGKHGACIPLGLVRGVEVPAAGDARDPRLDPWTVRTRAIVLDVVDREGRGVESFRVDASARGFGLGTYYADSSADGALELLVPAAPVDLEVSAQGYCARRLRDVVSDRRVVLGDAPELEITVRGDRSRLPEGADLPVRMDRSEGAPEQRRHRTRYDRFDALPASARFELPAAGRWEVRLFADYHSPIVPFGAPRSVDVPADGAVPPFELTITPDEIDAALRALAAAGR